MRANKALNDSKDLALSHRTRVKAWGDWKTAHTKWAYETEGYGEALTRLRTTYRAQQKLDLRNSGMDNLAFVHTAAGISDNLCQWIGGPCGVARYGPRTGPSTPSRGKTPTVSSVNAGPSTPRSSSPSASRSRGGGSSGGNYVV